MVVVGLITKRLIRQLIVIFLYVTLTIDNYAITTNWCCDKMIVKLAFKNLIFSTAMLSANVLKVRHCLFLAMEALASFPTADFDALRPPFSVRQAQCSRISLLKPAPFYKLSRGLLLLLLLFTRPLPRDGGMAEDHGAPEAGQLPRVWTRGHKETKSRQRVSGAKSPLLDSAE